MKKPLTWCVVADGGRARVLQPKADLPGYDTVLELESGARPRSAHELGSDRPGRTGESASTTRHAIEPRTDPHEAAKREFAEELAEVLADAVARHLCDALVLVAPPRFLGELRSSLPPKARKAIARELPKDLTKVPLAELDAHLAPSAG
jgi:protein required for attachment to host cells